MQHVLNANLSEASLRLVRGVMRSLGLLASRL